MKLRDARTKRFEVRMTEEEYMLLHMCAEVVARKPTEFVRLLLNSAFVEMRDILEKESTQDADKPTFLNDQLQYGQVSATSAE